MRSNEETGRSWVDLGIHLMTQLPYQLRPESPWLRNVIADSDAPGRVKAFQLVEGPHIQQIELAVERWLEGHALPHFEEPARQLLTLRFHVVGHLLLSLERALPSPGGISDATLLRSFLIDWWRRSGAHYAVGFECAEFDLPGQDS